jgi:hypothetical protein
MKERIRKWREFARERLQYWELAEQVASRAGLPADAAHCAMRRWEFMELLECLDRMEAIAA